MYRILPGKGVYLTNQWQVLDEAFFQHFPGMVNADWHTDLNRSASNRVQLTVAALCMQLGHVSHGARASGATRS